MCQRFWDRVEKTDSCWNWTGGNSDGYGKFRLGDKKVFAHRYSFYLTHGYWPINEVAHKCDNRSCVNPDHLEDKTHQENMTDAKDRERMRRGEEHGSTKFSDEIVAKVRAGAGLFNDTELGRIYKMSPRQVRRILDRKSRV